MNSNKISGKLGDIAEIIMGQSPPGDTCNGLNVGLPLLNGPTEFGSNHPLPTQFTTSPSKIAEVGDLLFCVRGSTTGRMNWAEQKYAIGRGIGALRHVHGKEYQPYLRGVIEYKLPELLTRATGSTFPNVSRDQLTNLDIPNHPLPVQKKIAAILSSLDDKIELNTRMNNVLEEIARALFHRWFVAFEFPDAEGKPYKSAGGKMVESEMGSVPEGWKVQPVIDFCDKIETGGTPKRNVKTYWEEGTIPWFKTGELIDETLLSSAENITPLGLKESNCKLWKPKTILIALYAAPTVGHMGILEITGTSNQACAALMTKKEYGYLYLYHSLYLARDNLQSISVGSAQQNLNVGIIKNYKLIAPTSSLTRKFSDIVEKYYSMIVVNQKEKKMLREIRDTLLPKLMNGEIEV